MPFCFYLRGVWRCQRGNQNPYIEEQTTQWPKEKVQKDKQRSTKHTYKTKDRVTRTPLKTGGELRISGRVSSSTSLNNSSPALVLFVYSRGSKIVQSVMCSNEYVFENTVVLDTIALEDLMFVRNYLSTL